MHARTLIDHRSYRPSRTSAPLQQDNQIPSMDSGSESRLTYRKGELRRRKAEKEKVGE